jgi:alanine racemase
MIPAALTTTFSPETARAWVDVDLAALLSNARQVAAVSGSRLLPMIKGNGYGLGAVEVARALEAVDPWGYGVASIEEAEILRSAGIDRPILVATPLLPQWIDKYLELDLRPSIGDPEALAAWIARGERPFHLEIDTGMGRAGVRWDDAPALERVRSLLGSASGWEGVYTHFLDAEANPEVTVLQWSRFQETLRALPRRPRLVHAANSAAAMQGSKYAGDLVRPGVFLYGGAAGSATPQPVAALRGRVVATRRLNRGDTVGYGGSWQAPDSATIATLAVGYADGFPRSARNSLPGGREIELNGRVVPVVARVTMDMCMALVEQPVRIGDVGTAYGGLVSLDRQAELAGTISYELLIRIGSRVPRRYHP